MNDISQKQAYSINEFLDAEMLNAGVGIDHRWEKNDLGGQHKRWWLREGHTSQEIPYPKRKKPSAEATATASSPNPISENGGLQDG